MGKNPKKQVSDAYMKMRKKMPDATTEELETAVRKYLLNRKLRPAGIYFGIALIAYFLRNHGADFIPNFDPNSLNIGEIETLGGIESLCVIISGISFCRSLHDPLTPAQIQEYEEREHLEKTGKPYKDCK